MKNGATYKKKSKLGVFSPPDFQESGALDRPVQGQARNLALSVFKAMRDSLPCGPKPSGLRPPKGFGPQAGDASSPARPRNDRPEGFFRSLLSPTDGANQTVGIRRAPREPHP